MFGSEDLGLFRAENLERDWCQVQNESKVSDRWEILIQGRFFTDRKGNELVVGLLGCRVLCVLGTVFCTDRKGN